MERLLWLIIALGSDYKTCLVYDILVWIRTLEDSINLATEVVFRVPFGKRLVVAVVVLILSQRRRVWLGALFGLTQGKFSRLRHQK